MRNFNSARIYRGIANTKVFREASRMETTPRRYGGRKDSIMFPKT
jgi:hypothetical protein